jgi:hypothetical protein
MTPEEITKMLSEVMPCNCWLVDWIISKNDSRRIFVARYVFLPMLSILFVGGSYTVG